MRAARNMRLFESGEKIPHAGRPDGLYATQVKYLTKRTWVIAATVLGWGYDTTLDRAQQVAISLEAALPLLGYDYEGLIKVESPKFITVNMAQTVFPNLPSRGRTLTEPNPRFVGWI